MPDGDAKWKQIQEFPNYWVSDDGRVINLKYKRMMTISWNGNNDYVTLYKDGAVYTRSVDKLVRRYFPKPIFIQFDKQKDWLEVPGFPRYRVCFDGRVYDTEKKEELAQYTNGHGCVYVKLRNGGMPHCRSVNKLVLDAFKIGREDALQLRTSRMENNRRVS